MSSKKNKTSKTVPGVSFISFSSVVSGSMDACRSLMDEPSKSSAATLLPAYVGADTQFAITAKKLLKKDSVTRLKALNEMRSILEVT